MTISENRYGWAPPRPDIAHMFRLLIAHRVLASEGVDLEDIVRKGGSEAYYRFEATPLGVAIDEALEVCFGDLILSGALDRLAGPNSTDPHWADLNTNCGHLIDLSWPFLWHQVQCRVRAN